MIFTGDTRRETAGRLGWDLARWLMAIWDWDIFADV
jgi:hypothetical protein